MNGLCIQWGTVGYREDGYTGPYDYHFDFTIPPLVFAINNIELSLGPSGTFNVTSKYFYFDCRVGQNAKSSFYWVAIGYV